MSGQSLHTFYFAGIDKIVLKGETKVYSTVYSQAVTHPSTNTAQPCLTSVIGRELVYSR